jgi:O-antigen ligase
MNYDRLKKMIFYLAPLMSFSNILVGRFNLSMILFIYIIAYASQKMKVFKISNKFHILAILFGIGALISVSDINAEIDTAFERSMTVIPNYLYWSLIVIVLTNISEKIEFISTENLEKLSGGLAIGVVFTVIFYEYINQTGLPFINDNTPNSYAFLLVCFTAISIKYLQLKKRKYLMLFIFVSVLISLLFLERRAGFVLVFASGLIALKYESLTINNILINSIFIGMFFLLLELSIVQNSIMAISPRIYETLYETENIKSQDQSYLTRVAQVEKAGIIFSEHPLTGIGLNNFAVFENVQLLGNFEGADVIMHKDLTNKGAHNSYIMLLAEGGLLIFIPFVLLLFWNIYYFIVDFNKRSSIETTYYFSFIAMACHLYFIAEIVNVFAWFLIAVVSCISLKYRTR